MRYVIAVLFIVGAATDLVPASMPGTKLSVFPAELSLNGHRDSRRLIVTATDENGKKSDVTSAAVLTAGSDLISIDADGFVVPQASGTTTVTVRVSDTEVSIPVKIVLGEPVPVDFRNEVNPIMSKVGCNQGTCHGSQKGQNGFKLSLRGYDALYDYRALIDDVAGRRFNRSQPGQSLMLLKPTQGVPHEGGFLFDENSRYYKVIQQWIAEGCQFTDKTNRVTALNVYPEKPLLSDADAQQQLIVIARYEDGTTRDVTREAVFDQAASRSPPSLTPV